MSFSDSQGFCPPEKKEGDAPITPENDPCRIDIDVLTAGDRAIGRGFLLITMVAVAIFFIFVVPELLK